MKFFAVSALLILGGLSCAKREVTYKGKPTSAWINDLSDRDSNTRYAAVQALNQIGPERGVLPALYAVMKDPDNVIRIEAAGAVEKLDKPEKFLPAFYGALHDRDYFLRRKAFEVIGHYDSPKVYLPVMRDALKDEDFRVRFYAATMLQKSGTPSDTASLVPIYVQSLGDGWDSEIKMGGLAGLTLIGPPASGSAPALERLEQKLADRTIFIDAQDEKKTEELLKAVQRAIGAVKGESNAE